MSGREMRSVCCPGQSWGICSWRIACSFLWLRNTCLLQKTTKCNRLRTRLAKIKICLKSRPVAVKREGTGMESDRNAYCYGLAPVDGLRFATSRLGSNCSRFAGPDGACCGQRLALRKARTGAVLEATGRADRGPDKVPSWATACALPSPTGRGVGVNGACCLRP